MSWKAVLGRLAALAVKTVAVFDGAVARPLSLEEKSLLTKVFGPSVDLEKIQLREGVRGLVNMTGRIFVIENAVYIPRAAGPLAAHVLVHEVCHIWQFQHGGHAYIGDSLHAQLLGDGYDLQKGLGEGKTWPMLNAEQQATLVEISFRMGCFEGRPFVLEGTDWTKMWRQSVDDLRDGAGAHFLDLRPSA